MLTQAQGQQNLSCKRKREFPPSGPSTCKAFTAHPLPISWSWSFRLEQGIIFWPWTIQQAGGSHSWASSFLLNWVKLVVKMRLPFLLCGIKTNTSPENLDVLFPRIQQNDLMVLRWWGRGRSKKERHLIWELSCNQTKHVLQLQVVLIERKMWDVTWETDPGLKQIKRSGMAYVGKTYADSK